MRMVQALLLVLILPLNIISADSPHLPYTFRVSPVTARFLDQAEMKVEPPPPPVSRGKP
jgi:hypothetical protein